MASPIGSVSLKSKSIGQAVPRPRYVGPDIRGRAQSPPSARAGTTGGGIVYLRSGNELTPISSRINALYAAGFRFATNHDGAGTIVALIGLRARHGVIDVVQLYGE